MAETSRASILLIYTGGTIGMKTNPETGALSPFDFNDMYEEFPYLRMLNVDISVLHFKPIDSSNVTPALWIELARLIRDSYASFDGFVVLHGTACSENRCRLPERRRALPLSPRRSRSR